MTRTNADEAENADEESEGRETMADVDHTHPHTDETFTETGVYDRGDERTADD